MREAEEYRGVPGAAISTENLSNSPQDYGGGDTS